MTAAGIVVQSGSLNLENSVITANQLIGLVEIAQTEGQNERARHTNFKVFREIGLKLEFFVDQIARAERCRAHFTK